MDRAQFKSTRHLVQFSSFIITTHTKKYTHLVVILHLAKLFNIVSWAFENSRFLGFEIRLSIRVCRFEGIPWFLRAMAFFANTPYVCKVALCCVMRFCWCGWRWSVGGFCGKPISIWGLRALEPILGSGTGVLASAFVERDWVSIQACWGHNNNMTRSLRFFRVMGVLAFPWAGRALFLANIEKNFYCLRSINSYRFHNINFYCLERNAEYFIGRWILSSNISSLVKRNIQFHILLILA